MTAASETRRSHGEPLQSQERVADFLTTPDAWKGARVEVIETHLSTVYLVGDHVYKRKKPLRFVGHDYTTLAARLESCEREVRVNRRLAPDVYLGHVPVCESDHGTLEVGGPGKVVEWLVHMRRVPIDRTLENGLRVGWATREDVSAIGTVLARFYADQPRLRVEPFDLVKRLSQSNRAHAAALRRVGIDAAPITSRVARFLRAHRQVIGERGEWQVAGHGDLRPEHVVLVRPPVFIDALDVPAVRVDPLDELGYLTLECELLDAPWARALLLEPWRRLSNDRGPDVVVDFYQTYRAGLRAHLYAVRLWDNRDALTVEERVRWTARAESYLRAGARHAASLSW